MPEAVNAKIAIITPVFRHSVLVMDAVESIISQDLFHRIEYIIVDDGCVHEQTVLNCASLCHTFKNIHYIRTPNGGLSAARNAGVDFCLKSFENCEAIYFLDADNRLTAGAVQRFFDVMITNPEADWFYPDIQMFGIEFHGDYSGPFRILTEAVMNICEAGSLVRRRVFTSGLRFDELMKLGYEDWEFWISAMEHGYRGLHLPASGFNYRKRAESMLSNSARRHEEIMNYMEAKHKWLNDGRVLVALENEDAPRYAIVTVDADSVQLCSDPNSEFKISVRKYVDQLRYSFFRPNWHAVGAYVVFTTQKVINSLKLCGLLNFVFWQLERDVDAQGFSAWSLDMHADRAINFATRDFILSANVELFGISMFKLRELLSQSSLGSELNDMHAMGFVGYMNRLDFPFVGPASDAALKMHHSLAKFMSTERSLGSFPSLWTGRPFGQTTGTPDLATLPGLLRLRCGGLLPNRITLSDRTAAFVFSVFEFGGVERVGFNVAKKLVEQGYQVDCIVIGSPSVKMPSGYENVFRDTYIFDVPDHKQWDGEDFMGTVLPRNWIEKYPDFRSLLQNYDVVINCHCHGLLYASSLLRKAGVIFVNYLHLFEYRRNGHSYGAPFIGLAFEHSIDIFACCSNHLAQEMCALGVPREKVIAVPNGPGIVIPDSSVTVGLEARSVRRRNKEPLRILFMGRLDLQKGLHHLDELIHLCNRERLDVSFRVIGGQVISASDSPLSEELLSIVEPPCYDEAEICGLYHWADIVVMPSLFEGLPLVLIEAMACGVVSICTDVGAVSEIVHHNRNGFLVSDEHIARSMFDRILELSNDRERLGQMADSAVLARDNLDWGRNVEDLIEKIEVVRKARNRHHSKSLFCLNSHPQ